jgi:hypothetical protein
MPDPLPHPIVNRSEEICRFLVEPRLFKETSKQVSGQAFKPKTPRDPGTLYRTSVYRIDGCPQEEIWSIAEERVTKQRSDGRKVLARADIKASSVFTLDLQLEPTPTPHVRHADIVGWPDQPEKRLEKANQLALRAQLVLPPSS